MTFVERKAAGGECEEKVKGGEGNKERWKKEGKKGRQADRTEDKKSD